MSLVSGSPNHGAPAGLPIGTVLTIDADTRARMARELSDVPSPYLHFEDALLAIEPIFARLPAELRRTLRRFQTDPDFDGALLIRGFPTDPELPETPRLGKRPTGKATFVSEACALGIAEMLGHVFAYASEKDGEMVHQLAPVQGSEAAKSNESSRIDFGPHTECGGLPMIPTFLLLYCLRADPGGSAATYFEEARDLLKVLDTATIEALQRPEFQMKVPYSFTGVDAWSAEGAILRGPLSQPELWYDRDGMRGVTPAAQAALAKLDEVAADPRVQRAGVLQPGDIVVLDNRKTVHGRRPFTPKWDGKDRWLHRVYVHRDLWEGRAIARGTRLY
jgi:L-asparagine oxygenase